MPITKATASSIAPAAKGDLVVGSATNDAAVLGVGSNDQVLTADSSTATGLKWAAVAAGGMSLIQRSSFSNVAGTSTTFDGVCTSTYATYLVIIENLLAASGADDLQVVLRTSGSDITGNIGNTVKVPYNSATWTNTSSGDVPQITMYTDSVAAAANGQFFINNVGQGFNVGSINGFMYGTSTNSYNLFFGNANTSSVVTGFRLKSASSNITGTVAVYGLAK